MIIETKYDIGDIVHIIRWKTVEHKISPECDLCKSTKVVRIGEYELPCPACKNVIPKTHVESLGFQYSHEAKVTSISVYPKNDLSLGGAGFVGITYHVDPDTSEPKSGHGSYCYFEHQMFPQQQVAELVAETRNHHMDLWERMTKSTYWASEEGVPDEVEEGDRGFILAGRCDLVRVEVVGLERHHRAKINLLQRPNWYVGPTFTTVDARNIARWNSDEPFL